MLVGWEGAPIHRRKGVKAFLQAAAEERLALEPRPGYRRPTSTRWTAGCGTGSKNVALANVCATDLAELRRELRAATARLRRKPAVIQASFVEAKLN